VTGTLLPNWQVRRRYTYDDYRNAIAVVCAERAQKHFNCGTNYRLPSTMDVWSMVGECGPRAQTMLLIVSRFAVNGCAGVGPCHQRLSGRRIARGACSFTSTVCIVEPQHLFSHRSYYQPFRLTWQWVWAPTFRCQVEGKLLSTRRLKRNVEIAIGYF